MKLLTRFELASRPTQELHRLYRDIFNALATTAPHSDARRACETTLEDIRRELRCRGPKP